MTSNKRTGERGDGKLIFPADAGMEISKRNIFSNFKNCATTVSGNFLHVRISAHRQARLVALIFVNVRKQVLGRVVLKKQLCMGKSESNIFFSLSKFIQEMTTRISSTRLLLMTSLPCKEKFVRFSFITLALMQCYSSAYAEPESALRPYVDYIFLYDDNVLRFSDSAAAQAAIGSDAMSDTAHRLEAGLIFEKKFSQQLVTAKLNLNHTDFNRFSELDHDGGAAQANWNWHVGSHVYGNIGAEYERSLTPFTNFHLLQRNMRDTHREYANGSWELHPRWRVNGGLIHYSLRYDLASQRSGNRDENTGEIGLDYVAPSESSIGVVLRHTRGTFPDPATVAAVVIDNRYEQNDVFGKIDWRYSVKTRVQFIGGWSERTHDFFPSRNYSGGSARLIAGWLPTYKTGVSLSAWREIGSTDNLTNSYTLNQGVSVAPSWNVTEKTKLEGLFKYETQDYSPASTGLAAATVNRKDTLRYSSLKISYAAMQKLKIAATIYHDRLTSNIPRTDYGAYGIWLNARYTF